MTRQIATRKDGVALEIVFDGLRAELLEDGVSVSSDDGGLFSSMQAARDHAQATYRQDMVDLLGEAMAALKDPWHIDWVTVP